MTLPRLGEIIETDKPDPGDELLTSVTTILSVLDKPALIPWAVKETAKWVVKLAHNIPSRLEQDGEEETIKWIEQMRWRRPEGALPATELGTLAHALFETYALTGTRPTVEREMHPAHAAKSDVLCDSDVVCLVRMLDQYDAFLQEFQPEFIATEVVVFSPQYGTAGTADGFVTMQGQRLIIDYKTSRETWAARGKLRGPYPEVGLQLAAYRYAEFAAAWRARRTERFRRRYYLLSEAEKQMAVPVPEVDGGVAVYITPERYGVHPVRCGEAEYEAFLYVLEVARWKFEHASEMVGNAMAPPFPIVDEGDPFEGLPQ